MPLVGENIRERAVLLGYETVEHFSTKGLIGVIVLILLAVSPPTGILVFACVAGFIRDIALYQKGQNLLPRVK